MKKKTRPIRKKEEVQQSNDEHIDQDYPGFPHHPSKEATISNGSASEGSASNGSANAFEGTEEVGDDEEDRGHRSTGHNAFPDRGK